MQAESSEVMPIVQVENLKRWLESYQERQRDIESSYERLERLEARLTSPRSAALSGVPGAAAPDPDRLTFPLAELQELREECNIQVEDLRDLRHRIEGAIRLIDGPGWPDQRAMLRMRYVDGERWETIAQLLFWRDPDFLVKQDSYIRRALKIRKAALKALAKNPRIDEFLHEEDFCGRG